MAVGMERVCSAGLSVVGKVVGLVMVVCVRGWAQVTPVSGSNEIQILRRWVEHPMFHHRELWQVVVAGGGSSGVSVPGAVSAPKYARLVVRLWRQGVQLVEWASWSFPLDLLPLSLDFGVVSGWGPVQYIVKDVAFAEALQKNGGYLPVGDYIVEYILLATNAECTWIGPVLARAEYPLHLGSELAIWLVTPADGDTIRADALPPVFTWQVGGVLPSGGRFRVRVASVASPQRRMHVLMDEGIVWEAQDLVQPAWVPHGMLPQLEEGWYVWQVEAYQSDGSVIGVSPVWTFYVAASEAPVRRQSFWAEALRLVPVPYHGQVPVYPLVDVDSVVVMWRGGCRQSEAAYVMMRESEVVVAGRVSVGGRTSERYARIVLPGQSGMYRLEITDCRKKFSAWLERRQSSGLGLSGSGKSDGEKK